MLQEPVLKHRETSIIKDSKDNERPQLTLQKKSNSNSKPGSEQKLPSNRAIPSVEEEQASSNKKSAFGKGVKGSDKLIIDFNKKEVNLQNSEDQEALIQILKKEVRGKKEIQFIDRAVCQLKFFAEKKSQLNEKLYGKLLEKLKYQFLEKEKPLFYHGSLILLLPPKPFEESAPIDELFQKRLQERYYRLRDHPEHATHRNTLFTTIQNEEDQIPRSPNLTSSRAKAATLSRYVNTAFKFATTNMKPQTPTVQSPLNVSGSTPQSRKQSYRLKGQDFDAEMNQANFTENIFELFCQAFFPNFKNAFTFNAGAGFGEIALLRKTERSGTVVGKEDCHLISLDKDSFDEVLGRWEIQKTDNQLKFLKSFSFFKDVNDKYLLGLLHSMKPVCMYRNEVVYKEDVPPENVYFIRDGEIELSKICSIQKTETLQQQLDKEEIDTLIRGNATQDNINHSPSTKHKHKNSNEMNNPSKRSKTEQKNGNDVTKKETGPRVKFSVISQPCYFGDEEILMELPYRNHMAKVLSTTAEIWTIDKKSFYQLLKQQRTFNLFQDQCKAQIAMRNERLQKISSTIKKEEDKFLVNIYKPKHGVGKRSIHQEQSLINLLKTTEDEMISRNNEDSENNPNQMNTQQHYQSQPVTNRDGQSTIAIASEQYDQKMMSGDKQQQLLQYFSRNNYLTQLAQANSKKMQILKEISSKGIGFNGQATPAYTQNPQSSLTEFDEDFSTSIVKSKHSIPFQRNLLFQPNVGKGIRKGIFRDPFQTYEDQVPHTTKAQKTHGSTTSFNFPSSDVKRNTLHNLYSTPKQNAIIKPIIEKFEKEKSKPYSITHRGPFTNKHSDSKKSLFDEDQSITMKQERNSLRVTMPTHFNSIQSSITHINEYGDDPKTKLTTMPLDNSFKPNHSSDSLALADKKSKYHNIHELIQESKKELQSISEVNLTEQKPKQKKTLKKMKSDIQFENDYWVNKVEQKPRSKQSSQNTMSIQLLHETEEDATGTSSSFLQSKGILKPSIHSITANSPKGLLKPLGDRTQKFESNDRMEQIQSSTLFGKGSRSSFQEIAGAQNQRRVISTLNLNASEQAFDSYKILLTEDTDQDENFVLNSPSNNQNPLSPSNQFKNLGLNSFRNTTSNIHMERLRKLNQPKQFGSAPYVTNYNKIRNSINKKFVKENTTVQTEPMFQNHPTTTSQQYISNSFKSTQGMNYSFKKGYSVKKQ